jgi:hypothetical protein
MNDVVVTPPLSVDEDTFALAVIEYGGNLGAAYRSVYGDKHNAAAQARLMITRPEIAKRIHELTVATEEHALISLGSHLMQLARLRDLAVDKDQMKVALTAEVKRGEVAGFYTGKAPAKNPNQAPAGPSVTINIGTSPKDVKEWAAKQGTTVIDV